MVIITGAENRIVVCANDYYKDENGYVADTIEVNGSMCEFPQSLFRHYEVDSVPEGVVPFEYTYTPENGFQQFAEEPEDMSMKTQL